MEVSIGQMKADLEAAQQQIAALTDQVNEMRRHMGLDIVAMPATARGTRYHVTKITEID